jgi:hypothetical protein
MIDSLDSMPPGIADPQAQPNPFRSDQFPAVGIGNLPMIMKLYLTMMKNQASTNPQLEKNNPFLSSSAGQDAQVNPDLNSYFATDFIRQLLGKYF